MIPAPATASNHAPAPARVSTCLFFPLFDTENVAHATRLLRNVQILSLCNLVENFVEIFVHLKNATPLTLNADRNFRSARTLPEIQQSPDGTRKEAVPL